jgi:AcrR family transcriptional regulator
MAKKAPRRTAERIASVTLDLFNRYGEPHVSTTMISSELGISPGNLYYHFASKDKLVNHLYDQFEASMLSLLEAGGDVLDIEDAWFFLHTLFEKVWDHRFLYRDLNHLLSGNRHLEKHFHAVLERKTLALRQMLESLAAAQVMQIAPDHIETLSTGMAVMVTYWLSYEYVRDPRHAMEPESASRAMGRGAGPADALSEQCATAAAHGVFDFSLRHSLLKSVGACPASDGQRTTGGLSPAGLAPTRVQEKRCWARVNKPSKIRLSTSSNSMPMLGAIFQPAPPVMTHMGSMPVCARRCCTMRSQAPAIA